VAETTALSECKYSLMSNHLNIFETIKPSWDDSAERNHYLLYKHLLEREYGDSRTGIVWDNTNRAYVYLSQKKYEKMKILHTRHGFVYPGDFDTILDTKFPRVLGISRTHADYLSSTFNIQARYICNGISLPPQWRNITNNISNSKVGSSYNKHQKEQQEIDYLLSLNRISPEKGIHHAIDLAIATHSPIKIAVDDTHVSDPLYVKQIIKRCSDSRGYAEYYGLVDNKTKEKLLRNCKAVIGCPESYWIEAFGLYALEANSYGKPVLALRNGGLNEIVVNGVNGFLAENFEELKGYVEKIQQCNPEACRKRVEDMFSDEVMTNNYLRLFEKVLEEHPESRW
jgi:glycosyltransferase involved in cell wall biosynthesis